MPDVDPPISLPPVEELQFRRALPVGHSCVVCKQAIADDYYQAQGQVVCPTCAGRIQSGVQAAPSSSLLRAALYGAGAALAGCALYALVSIVTGLEIGIIAIVVGIMVGKAIRYASRGLGGRPQQILAVLLTYFAITTSYIPVYVYHAAKSRKAQVASEQNKAGNPSAVQSTAQPRPRVSRGRAVVYLLGLVAAAPFLALFAGGNPIGALISLFIIYIGLQRAWALTGKPQILVVGPYKLSGT